MIVLSDLNKHIIRISESQLREICLLNEHMDVVNNFNLAKRQISTNKADIKNVITKLNQRFNKEFGDYANKKKKKRTNGIKRGQESQVENGNHSNILLYSSAVNKSKNVPSPQWNKGRVQPYTEQRLKSSLKENKSILEEGLSDILYHFTTIKVLSSIVKTNSMICSSSYSNTRDRLINPNYPFFISFTRQHNNNFGYVSYMNRDGNKPLSQLLCVRITFDGRRLNSNYKGNAVNYHNIENPRNKQQQMYKDDPLKMVEIRQSEDRLYSNSPIIADIDRYIIRIDILVPKKDFYNSYCPTLNLVAKILKNPTFKNKIFVYEDERTYNIPNCSNFINDKIANYINGTSLKKYIVGDADNTDFKKLHKASIGREKKSYLSKHLLVNIGVFIAILALNRGQIDLNYVNDSLNYMLQDYKNNIGKTEYNKEYNIIIKAFHNAILSPNALKQFSFNYFCHDLRGDFRVIYARSMELLNDFLANSNNLSFSTLKTNAVIQTNRQ
jgi:hypothetical protein